jgi:probable HAF family extracellular repeat protein
MIATSKSEWSIGLALFCLIICAAPGHAQTYTVTDLGAIAGDNVSKGYALNDAGQAAGVSETPTAAIATLFSNGKATNISTLGGSVSVATAINLSGEAAGWNFFNSSPSFDPQAFVYSNGIMKSIDSPSLFPSGTEALAINNAGEVVGTGYFSSGNFHAFLYSNGKMTDLGPSGAFQSSAIAINNSGQIIGGYALNSGAAGEFLISGGKMTTLPVPAGASAVSAFGIGDNGEIVGQIFFESGAPSQAGRLLNGVWTELGAFSGASATRATSVNNSGQIVGTAFFPQTQYHPPKPGKHVPVLSTAGGLVNLNLLIPATTGFVLTDAIAINNSGQILCDATNSAGKEHAVLLNPK